MEFELGQTYSGYKFLDVVRRSRSAVQYRVQNTLAQRVESLRTLTAPPSTIPMPPSGSCARCAFAPGSRTRTSSRSIPPFRLKGAWR